MQNPSNRPLPAIKLPDGYFPNEMFCDEFDSANLDNTKWYDFAPQWHGRQPGYFDRKNVYLSNGCLNLVAHELKPEEVSVENKVRGYDKYSTAYVCSKTRIRYGYFETRFRSMSAAVCNAFWLHDPLDPPAKYRPGDFTEEIDIFEVFGKTSFLPSAEAPNPAGIYWTTLHRLHTPYVETKVFLDKPGPDAYHKSCQTISDIDFSSGFHTGSLLWTPEIIRWYLDGEQVWEQENSDFHRALYMNIDCEIMQNWSGLPDSSDLDSVYSIDYVRVWQKADE